MSQRNRQFYKKGKVKIGKIVSRKPGVKREREKQLPAARLLGLQRIVGNRAVGRLVRSGVIRAKLTVGKSDSVHEKEADRVSERVMGMPGQSASLVRRQEAGEDEKDVKAMRVEDHTIRRKEGAPEEKVEEKPQVERKGAEEEEKAGEVESKRIPGNNSNPPQVTPGVEASINDLRGGGRRLSESARSFFEPRFGRDFSGVRVHDDARAEEAARSIRARAFTTGRDIVFGAGQYSPGTSAGKRLLAHELTHVVQQGGGKKTGKKTLIDATAVRAKTESASIQRKGGGGPVLTSGRFRGNAYLAAVLNNKKTLEKGNKGKAVLLVQEFLLSQGYSLPKYGADGDFGGETKSAVEAFQKKHNLGTDGVVGFKTIGTMDKMDFYDKPSEGTGKKKAKKQQAKKTGTTRVSGDERPLTASEIKYAKVIFGNSLDYTKIRVNKGNLVDNPMAIKNTIYLMSSWGHFVGNTLTLTKSGRETLIHEMVHSWQYQVGGLDYIPEALLSYIKDYATGSNIAYDWRVAHKAGTPWKDWIPDQQAEAIEEFNIKLRKLRGGKASLRDIKTLRILKPYVDNVRQKKGAP